MPTISCVIDKYNIENALLNLGASVNMLPYFIYKQLGLGELKSTPITLQLIDILERYSKHAIEDVLV